MIPILLSAAVMLVAAGVVAWPLVRDRVEPYLSGRPMGARYSERTALLEALSELEQEYRAGKLSEADYRHTSERLQRDYLRLVEPKGKRPQPQAGS